MIEALQLMNIFIYIIIKAKMSDIIVYCKIISLFTTCTTKSSMILYSLKIDNEQEPYLDYPKLIEILKILKLLILIVVHFIILQLIIVVMYI